MCMCVSRVEATGQKNGLACFSLNEIFSINSASALGSTAEEDQVTTRRPLNDPSLNQHPSAHTCTCPPLFHRKHKSY